VVLAAVGAKHHWFASAPGTGLGVSAWVPDATGRFQAALGGRGRPCHAVSHDVESTLLGPAAQAVGVYVVFERVLSGSGWLQNLYRTSAPWKAVRRVRSTSDVTDARTGSDARARAGGAPAPPASWQCRR
jgi:glucokinase